MPFPTDYPIDTSLADGIGNTIHAEHVNRLGRAVNELSVSVDDIDTISGGGSLPGYYNIKDYGAIGNNIADDTNAIQNAITDAQTFGGIVWVPPGTYKITATLHANRYINGVSGAEHQSFRITGAMGGAQANVSNPTIMYSGTDDTARIIDMRSAHGSEIDHIRIRYSSATYSGKMLDISGELASDYIMGSVHHVAFQDNLNTGGALSAECNIWMNKTIITRVYENVFDGAQWAIKTGTSYVVQVVIGPSNLFSNVGAGTHAILNQSNDNEKMHIDANTFEAGSTTGILKSNPNTSFYGLSITNNWWGDSISGDYALIDGIYAVRDIAVYAFNKVLLGSPTTFIKFGDPDGSNSMGGHLVFGNTIEGGPLASCLDTYTLPGIGAVTFVHNGHQSPLIWKGTATNKFIADDSGFTYAIRQSPIYYAGGNWMDIHPDPNVNSGNGLMIGPGGAAQSVYPSHPDPLTQRQGVYSTAWSGSGKGTHLVGSANANGRATLNQAGAGVGTAHVPVVEVRGTSGGVSQLGFFNKTPVQRPATYTLNAGTKSRNLPSGATLAEIEAVVRQFLTDVGDTSGYGLLDDTT